MRTFIRTVLHFFANWFFNSLCIYSGSRFLPGFHLIPQDGIPIYLLVMELGLLLTVMNTTLRPVLLMLLLPLNVLTVGLFSLALNGVFIFLLDRFSESLEVAGFGTGVAAMILFALMNIVLQMLIPLDDDIIYFSILGQRNAAKNAGAKRSKGIVMLEIDGLSYPRMMKAAESGHMPFLKDLLNSGSFRAHSYDCGIPSQTSSCQAGIMYGRNENICAFRWYDKKNHRVYSSSKPADAAEMEKMLFNGERPSGILNNGMSVNNIISGNASENVFTISRLRPGSREEIGRLNRDIYYFSLRPYLLTKSIIMTLLDAGREVLLYGWDFLTGKAPRLNRLKGFYPFVRGATNILLRDISAVMVADAVAGGKEAIYTTFIGYDEIAHHSGPDSHEAINALGGIDRSIRKIYEAIQITNARSYELVILSDHGQSFGPTFKQRYGLSLGDFIQSLAVTKSVVGKKLRVVSVEDADDNNANVMALLSTFGDENSSDLVRQATGNIENAISENEQDAIEAAQSGDNDILVLASGNLVHAYFQDSDDRFSYEEIEAVYPGMIAEMVRHPGVGTVFVHTESGPVAFGKEGTRNLYTGEIEGKDPLIMYEEPDLRAKQLRYLMDFPSGGDLVIISPVYEDGSVAAYEELIGSHGGLGGQQTNPFLMYSSAITHERKISNSCEVFDVLKKIKNTPVPVLTENKSEDTTSPGALIRQIFNIRNWIFTLARTIFFSPSAYREAAENASFNGPALFVGFLTFFSTWFVMNRYFARDKTGIFVNFGVLALIYGIEILASYLTVIIFRGRRKPWILIRTMLFTGYFGILWLFLLTEQAAHVWFLVILLLRVVTFTSSVITAGELKRRHSIPVFIILVILIPLLTVAVLMINNFIRFVSLELEHRSLF